MVHIAICDDNIDELELTYQQVCAFSRIDPKLEISVRRFQSSYDLLECIDSRGGFDIYLLDVIMPHKNGIEVGEIIRDRDQGAVIIYLTTSSDFAVESYRVKAQQYLLKPISQQELNKALRDVLVQLENLAGARVLIRTKSGTAIAYFNEIAYVEYRSHHLIFTLHNGKELESSTLRVSFDQAVESLNREKRFLKISSSFLINMDHIRTVTAKGFVMIGGKELPVTRTYAGAKQKYLDYIL